MSIHDSKKLILFLIFFLIFPVFVFAQGMQPAGGVTVAHSSGGGYPADVIVAWEMNGWTLDKYNATDGGTVTQNSASLSGGQLDPGTSTSASFPCTNDHNISAAQGYVEFKYTYTAGSIPSNATFFSHSSALTDFLLVRVSSTRLDFYIGGTYAHLDHAAGMDALIFDGNQHTIRVTWVNSIHTAALFVDGNAIGSDSGHAFSFPTLTGSLTIGNSVQSSDFSHAAGGLIDAFRISNTAAAP